MAKKKTSATKSNFLYFNPNPTVKYKKSGEPYRWHKGDCALRAVCGATDTSWIEIYDSLSAIAREDFTMPNDRDVVGKYLTQNGFKWIPIKVTKGSRRPLVRELALKESVGHTMVVDVANHLVCAKDGCYFDVWDSGYRSVYGYWVKELSK